MLYLHGLEVADMFRRRGLGRALVQAFMSAGGALGASEMFLTTGETDRPAQALHGALGGGLAEQGPTVIAGSYLRRTGAAISVGEGPPPLVTAHARASVGQPLSCSVLVRPWRATT